MTSPIKDVERSYHLVKSIVNDPTITDKIVPEFNTKLKQALEILSNYKKDIATNPRIIKEKIIHLLKDLNLEVDRQTNLSGLKVQKIHEKLTRAEEIMQGMEKNKESIPGGKVEVRLGFFCDLDSRDHNGFLAQDIKNALESNLPFVTTKSVLQMTGYNEELLYKPNPFEEELIKNKSQ